MSTDVWLKELEKINSNNEIDGISMDEFGEQLKIGRSTALKRMRLLINAKKWVCIGRRSSITIDGRPCSCPVYAPIKGKSNGKK